MKTLIGFFTGGNLKLIVAGVVIAAFGIMRLQINRKNKKIVKLQEEVINYARTDSISRAEKDSCEALRFTMERNYQLQVIKLTQAAKKYENRAVYAEAQNTALKNNGACKYATEIKVGPFLNKRKGLIYTSEPCRGDTVWLD